MEGGNLLVPVLINGRITLDFTIDSGASDVTIPLDVASTLWRTGTLQKSDFIGQEDFVLADGSIKKNATFLIRSLKVGNHLLEKVKATVVDANSDPLLGQSFLSKFNSWSIDNQRQVLLLNAPPGAPLNAPQAGTPQPQIASPSSTPLIRGWLGVEVQPVTPEIADSMGLKDTTGALVAEPKANSPAVAAGIQSGDVVTAVNGEPVRDARHLARLIGAMAPGTTVTLDLIHDGQQKTVSLTLGTLPNEMAAGNEPGPFEPSTAQPEATAPSATTTPTVAPPQSCWMWSANLGRWVFVCGQAPQSNPVAQLLPWMLLPFVTPPYVGQPYVGRRWFGRRR